MYQIDIFDKFGAILARFTFSYLTEALAWMVKHRTGKIVSDMGTVIKAPVEWELTRLPVPHQAMKIGEKSRSQARRLAYQRGERY